MRRKGSGFSACARGQTFRLLLSEERKVRDFKKPVISFFRGAAGKTLGSDLFSDTLNPRQAAPPLEIHNEHKNA